MKWKYILLPLMMAMFIGVGTGEGKGKAKWSKKEIFRKCSPAVVLIYRETSRGGQIKFGSGTLVHSKGVIITNRHVVGKAAKVKVLLKTNDRRDSPNVEAYIRKNRDKGLTAKVLRAFDQTDLAVLQIETSRTDYPTLKMGNSDEVEVGEDVVVIGHPRGLGWSITTGIISSVRTNSLQTDAAINSGNSGGPTIDNRGRMIGLTTYRIDKSQNLGFALPINLVRFLVQDVVSLASTKTERRDHLRSPQSTMQSLIRMVGQWKMVKTKKGRSAVRHQLFLSCFHPEVLRRNSYHKILVETSNLLQVEPRLGDIDIRKKHATMIYFYDKPLVDDKGKKKHVMIATLKNSEGQWKVTSLRFGHRKREDGKSKGQTFEGVYEKIMDAVRRGDRKAFLKFCRVSEFLSEKDSILAVYGREGRLGRLHWKTGMPQPLGAAGWLTIGGFCLGPSYLYITSRTSGKLYQVDLATGKDRVLSRKGWTTVTHLVGYKKWLYGVDVRSNSLFRYHLERGQWEEVSRGFKATSIMVRWRQYLYLVSKKSGKIFRVNMENHREKLLPTKGWQAAGAGCVYQGKLYVNSKRSGKLFEIDLTTGRDRAISKGWSQVVDMVTGNKCLYICTTSGRVYRFYPTTGHYKKVAGLSDPLRLLAVSPQVVARHHLLQSLFPYLQWQLEQGTEKIRQGEKKAAATTGAKEALIEYRYAGPKGKKMLAGVWLEREGTAIWARGFYSRPAGTIPGQSGPKVVHVSAWRGKGRDISNSGPEKLVQIRWFGPEGKGGQPVPKWDQFAFQLSGRGGGSGWKYVLAQGNTYLPRRGWIAGKGDEIKMSPFVDKDGEVERVVSPQRVTIKGEKWVEKTFVVTWRGSAALLKTTKTVDAWVANEQGQPQKKGTWLYISNRSGASDSIEFGLGYVMLGKVAPGEVKKIAIPPTPGEETAEMTRAKVKVKFRGQK